MSIIEAIILGVIEGVTEFLPISSTGHLILAARCLGLAQTEFVKSFQIVIQLGAILSVVVLYWKTFLSGLGLYRKLFVAFIPTAIVGSIFYRFIKGYLFDNNKVIIWALFLGGVAIILFEHFYRERGEEVKELPAILYPQAFLIGLFQSLAVIPGVSRAAATIIGGLIVGLSRKIIVEFSFLLAVPTMAAAASLDLLKSANSFSKEQFAVLIMGFFVSFIVALLTIKFLLIFIKKHNFVLFGIYRILLALVFWFKLR